MSEIKNNIQLNYKHLDCKQLSLDLLEKMYELMQENYQDISKVQFLKDLSKKQFVGLLFDVDEQLRGFTTFAVNPNNCGTEKYSVLFSGDTIISPQYWGTIELIRGWCLSVARIMKSNRNTEWYWFLLSKGHRTFMYLPLFFYDYYPQLGADIENQKLLFNKLEKIATTIYPNLYQPNSGIIRFPIKGGELKSELAQATFEKANKDQIKWFLEKNPEFYKGAELICLTKVCPENMRGYAKEFLMKNLNHDD